MIAVMRSPRLLVKLPAAPAQTKFSFGQKTLDVSFEQLFSSIRPPERALGAAPVPVWYAMSPGESAAEAYAWDLCHHLVTQGFGVAGLPAAEFAEPDLEQQWITGTPVQHAL